jgi:hypothetical protein
MGERKGAGQFQAVHADIFVVSQARESHRTVKAIPRRHLVIFWHKDVDTFKSDLSHCSAKSVEWNFLERPSNNGLMNATERRVGLVLFHKIVSLRS